MALDPEDLSRDLPEPRPPIKTTPPAGEGVPQPHGQSRVTLLAVNSYLVHAYWDVDRDALPAPNPPATLRFHDVTHGSSPSSFDVTVDLDARNWYVHLWSPAQAYYAELGWNEGGEFHSLAKSNPVETPRAWPVSEEEPQSPRSPASPPPAERTAEEVAAAAVAPPANTRDVPESPETRPQPEGEFRPQPEARPPLDAAETLRRRLEGVYAAHGVPAPSVTTPETPPPFAPAFEAPIERLENAAEPPPQHRVDAAETLRRRLAEIRGLGGESADHGAVGEAEAKLPSAHVSACGDLTSQAEARFSPGVSSASHAPSCCGERKG